MHVPAIIVIFVVVGGAVQAWPRRKRWLRRGRYNRNDWTTTGVFPRGEPGEHHHHHGGSSGCSAGTGGMSNCGGGTSNRGAVRATAAAILAGAAAAATEFPAPPG